MRGRRRCFMRSGALLLLYVLAVFTLLCGCRSSRNVEAQVRSVCRKMQVPETWVSDVDDRETMCVLAVAISRHENGVDANIADVERGWELL